MTSILQGFDQKNRFFDGWSWFKFNNLGLAIGTNLKFYTSLSKGLKLKVRKFRRLILTFVEVTGKKLVGGPFCSAILNRVNLNWSNKYENEFPEKKDKSFTDHLQVTIYRS